MQDTVVLYSSITPDIVLSQLGDTQTINICNQTQESLFNALAGLDFLFLIDFTYSKSYTPLISSVSDWLNTAFLSPYSSEISNKHKCSIHLSVTDQVQSILSLINLLSISKYIILSSASYYDLQIANELRITDESRVYHSISYQENADIFIAENIVSRMIKAKGIKSLIIIDHSESLNVIELALVNKKLVNAGAIFIYPSKNIWLASLDGSLIIVENGLEYATSQTDYEIKAVENVIDFINSNLQQHSITNIDELTIANILEGYNIKNKGFNIVNIQGNNRVIVGNITILDANNSLNYISSINNRVYFPGNITTIEPSRATKIVISIANGTTDTKNYSIFPLMAYFYEGALYAVARSNAQNEIPNFYIDLFPTDCGITWYDPHWFAECFANYTGNLGIAYLTNLLPSTLIGNMITLEKMGVDIPQICPLNPVTDVVNGTKYPQLFFLGDTYQNGILNQVLTLKSLGFNSIVILISKGADSLGPIYEYLVTCLQQEGFTIMNTEENRFLPRGYTRNDFEKYKSIFQHVKDTLCNLYFISFIGRPEMVLEGLYDIGLRKGDFIMIGDNTITNTLKGVEEPYYSKRKELLDGLLISVFKEYVGELGQEINAHLSTIFPDTTYMCLTYDSFSVVKEAIIYLLSIGEDYENPSVLSSAIRNNKIVGCLGNVGFGSKTNSRSLVQYTIQQLNFNTTLNTTVLREIAHINIFSAQLITMVNNFEWPTGSLPLNMRPADPCPFDSFLVEDSDKGKALLYAFSGFFFLLALGTSIIGYIKINSNFEEIAGKMKINFADMLFFSYFPIQFFQFITMGPDQDSYKYALQNFQVLISLDFNLYFNVTFEKFWLVFYAILIFVVLWIILCIFDILECSSRFSKFYLCRRIEDLALIIVPLFGHIGFLSIFSMLMNIYLCNQQISNALTDSFLQNDCTKFCYTDYHKTVIGITTTVISIYLPIFIISRPHLESFQKTLHLKTKGIYLYALSLFQIILVILNKTLKSVNQTTHGIACTLLIIAFFIFTIWIKPYNYKRANISQLMSLAASVWAIGISTIFRNYSIVVIWVIVEFIGILIILIIGIKLLKKADNYLVFEKGREISELFFFQFFQNYEKYIKNSTIIVMSPTAKKYMEVVPEEVVPEEVVPEEVVHEEVVSDNSIN